MIIAILWLPFCAAETPHVDVAVAVAAVAGAAAAAGLGVVGIDASLDDGSVDGVYELLVIRWLLH